MTDNTDNALNKFDTYNKNSGDNYQTTNAYTLVIPAWNESSHIEQTLHAACAAMADQPFPGSIVVVDNNSSDNTAALAELAGATVVFEPINQIARARNTGAQACNSAWLIFVDADTHINPVLLNASLEALSSGEVIGGGSSVALDREVTGLTKMVLGGWNWWSVKSSTAAGCFIYCTKEAFETVGGFDEKQYAAEELYLSKKLKKLAKLRNQKFLVQTISPVISSARKLDWYSSKQMLRQAVLLLIPGATRSKRMCGVWYDRSNINNKL